MAPGGARARSGCAATWLLAQGLAAALILTSCGNGKPPLRRATGALPSGVVARVGTSQIAEAMVARIVAVQAVSPKKALEHAVTDALFGLEASLRLPATRRAPVERAAFARALLESLDQSAVSQGPPSAAEIERITEERWVDLDRPVSVLVSHAVALFPKNGERVRALAVARAIQQAVHGIQVVDGFLKAARSVPAGEIVVRAERLPYLTADGRAISPEADRPRTPAGSFDPTFAAAANALSKPGDQSEIVETRFGYHIIFLQDRLPERRVPERERRAALGSEVQSRRADALRRELLTTLKANTRVEVRRDADEQTARLAE